MPSLSVVIPVYKVENYIRKCIESVLNQTYTDFELILVNDGSPDKSGEICDEYANIDRRIRVFHKQNEGVSIARNYGIEHSSADWICFIDSDDWVENNYLDNFFRNHAIDESTLVYQGILFDYQINVKKNKPFFIYPNVTGTDRNFSNFIPKYRILHDGCPVAKLFNKNLLKKYSILFNATISTHEDHVFVLSYLLHVKKIVLVSEIGYHYMIRNEISLSRKEHSFEDLILASDLLINNMFKCREKFQILNEDYFNSAITSYGLSQLIYSIGRVDRYSCLTVFSSILKRKNLFVEHFIEKKRKVRFFLFLLFRGIPFPVLCILIRLNRRISKIRLN